MVDLMDNELNTNSPKKYHVIDDVRFSYRLRGDVKQIVNCYIN